jgi:hypothetical protein
MLPEIRGVMPAPDSGAAMRFGRFDALLAAVAMVAAAGIGWLLQQEDPTIWAVVGGTLFLSRIALR